jgi:hypothetical protein
MPRRPDFFIIGAPKCGTTAMYAYLRDHPDLFLPERKELRYFGRDLLIRDRRPLTEAEYLAHFDGARSDQLVGTAYVWYLYSKTAAQEIRASAPDARIVAMLRNPPDLLHALHGENLFNGNEDIQDFGSALDAEADRVAGRRIPRHAHLLQALWYSTVPRFTEQLRRYEAAFGRERMHVIVFDDFSADPAAAYADLLRFVGVSAPPTPPHFAVVNAAKRTRSERLRHFLARPPGGARRVVRALLPPTIRRGVYERAKRLNVVERGRPPLDGDLRERLRSQHRDEVARLSEYLGRDLSHWVDGPSASRTGDASS